MVGALRSAARRLRLPTTLLLIRHGETEWNRIRRIQGHADVPLNETGRMQAAAVAARLVRRTGPPIRAVYTSDLRRARETAEILGRALGMKPRLDSRLREIDMGVWVGLTFVEVSAQYPALAAQWAAGEDIRRPGGETVGELWSRAAEAAADIVAAHPGQTVVVVTHGGTLRVIVADALEYSMEQMFSMDGFANASITELRLSSDGVSLHFDDSSGLPAEKERGS